VTPDALALLLELQGATTIHDAHELAVDAVKAGATGEQVREAINAWLSLQNQQVQTVVSIPIRCRCSHGPSAHTGGHGRCWQYPCGCGEYRDPVEESMARHPSGRELVNEAGIGLDPAREIPARFDERYDPSPEPIDRSIS
jgi:hypothetical protein